MRKILLVLGLGIFCAIPAQATTRTAATCAVADVQTQVNASSNGDTVIIPACSQTNWTTGLVITVGITLQGQGASTIIGDNVSKGGSSCSGGAAAFQINLNDKSGSTGPNPFFRMTGITIVGVATDPGVCQAGHIKVTGYTHAIRIDHNTINPAQTVGIYIDGDIWGVIDHHSHTGDFVNGVRIEHINWNLTSNDAWGDNSYAVPIQYGSYQGIYIESSSFTSTNAAGDIGGVTDCFSGGRFVFRDNSVTMLNQQSHGTDSDQRSRGCRWQEGYNNTFTYTNINILAFMNWIRGGTGVFFNNTVSTPAGYTNKIVQASNCRDASAGCGGGPDYPPWAACNGSGTYDQNSNSTGWVCIGQPGSGTSDQLGPDPSSGFPNPINDNCCVTPLHTWAGAVSDPIYVWGNTLNGVSNNTTTGSTNVVANRDYFAGTVRPGYTPAAFPHPLVTGGSATPGFVSEAGKNSTLTVALGASGGSGIIPTSTCASFSYCIPFAENALTGNLGIAAFQYANASAVTSTVTDDHSNTWTCIGSSAASGTKFLNLCYTPNLVAGTHKVTLTFGTTAVTQVQADVAQFFNIATSAPLRTSSSIVGTSSTTMTGPALTTSAGDLTYAMFCRTGTPLMTSGAFTPGSGWTLGLAKYQDGCATEWQVSAGGSITPTMTMGSASTYIVYAADFIPSSSPAGTAPTSPYLQRVMSWSSQSGTSAASTKFQLPDSTGDLLVMTGAGAVNYLGNSITDAGNTWTLAGQCTQSGSCSGSGGYSYEFYNVNAAANATNTQTVNFTGSGDATIFFYDFVGTFAFSTRGQFSSNANTTNALPATAFSFAPGVTNALTIAIGPIAFNTAQAVSQPTTGTNYFDGGWFGGETINGGSVPESIIDQNNIFSHTYQTGISGGQSWQWTTAVNSSEANNVGVDFVSFSTSAPSGSVTFAPTSLAFGTVPQGTTSAGMVSTISNTTGSTITFTSLPLSGTNAGNFSLFANTCGGFSGSTLTNGSSCTVTYKFSPTSAPGTNETATATLNFTGGGTSPITLALSGTSGNNAGVSFTPAGTLVFGNQVPNTTSPTQNVIVTSTGTGSLILAASNAVTLTGTNAANFAIGSNTCTNGLTLTPTQTCTITLTFTPTAAGLFVAQINLSNNAAGSPQVELLQGTGASVAPAPILTLLHIAQENSNDQDSVRSFGNQ